MDKPAILTVEKLRVSFDHNVILSDLSFTVSRGGTVAIIGPNGAGKTALFRSLIGSIPHKGSVTWAPGVRIGYVPQKLGIDRNLSVTLRDFLSFKRSILHLPELVIPEVLRYVHLGEDKLNVPLGGLSGGDLQRALVALALIGNPDVLLFDEPTAGVDLPGEERIYHTLHELQDRYGITLIFISHDLNLVYRYADTVICLNRSLVCFGSPEETLNEDVLDKLYGSKIHHHLHQHE
ncbi:MAG: ABC transporter ATP-binding protein [Candidatus Harrisonbacteria bacterium CG10_big_fil_rev_8_21_14_0_10_40_38]|uniref:ABC transporter ATP-binding protein n=1 Tax=Candidatus Harrisonbacteria bacterium CG10_big_fil_rev_8_21_14_0_10_40_38 TaxID=1974583 RepID=A0A2H0URJ7_9BACT|nr:MAG: ABC transporter ATP-binding protein [Candidatus Harrisonbacteria bacterium CG10_big_fil_rev_8_21_14_0_10_40_38]